MGGDSIARRDSTGALRSIPVLVRPLASLTRRRRAAARDIQSRLPRAGGLVLSIGVGEKMERPPFLLASARNFNNLRFTARNESTRLARPARKPGMEIGQAEAAP